MELGTARYTAILPSAYLEELLKKRKAELYDEAMREAAQDPDFMERTMHCHEDFAGADAEVESSW